MYNFPASCDIFCTVVDNFGDIGVCWRLARQLADEHKQKVRLWVDDLASFARLCPEVDASAEQQIIQSVEVRHWGGQFPEVQPAELVIEGFACKLPDSYVLAMASLLQKPIWLNLEYLCAEDWVESHHKLPSPHSTLPLTKFFFFPGFTPRTGGLLMEQSLLSCRDLLQRSDIQQQGFWQSIGIEQPDADMLKVSLFSYENNALRELFDVWAKGQERLICLVPEGRILPQVGQYFGDAASCAGREYVQGNLHVRILPFLEQRRYDELLWSCDVNFVRGEDSLVRAIFAGRPFVWQIYPQHDGVHLGKLAALCRLYGKKLSPRAMQALNRFWNAWNEGQGAKMEWSDFTAHRHELEGHTRHWALQLSGNNLALNILDFSREIGRMRALKIEG